MAGKRCTGLEIKKRPCQSRQTRRYKVIYKIITPDKNCLVLLLVVKLVLKSVSFLRKLKTLIKLKTHS